MKEATGADQPWCAAPAGAWLPYPPGCRIAYFVARHKRFTVELSAQTGTILAHSNNSGSMLGLLRPGNPVLISPAPGKNRKLAYTQEAVWLGDGRCGEGGFWVGVNTSAPNRMLRAAFEAGMLDFAGGYTSLRMEARCGQSRLDASLEGDGLPRLWVECKSVTLVEEGVAAFPDASSERGRKHLAELMARVGAGERGAMFYLVQRPDAGCFAPADYIDPEYARLFYRAMAAGVEIYAHACHVEQSGIRLGARLPVQPQPADAG